MQTTAERLVRGTVAAYVRHGAGLAAGLVVTPLLVRGVGSEQYGLWVVFQSILSYVTLLDLGMAPAATNRLAALDSASGRSFETTYATVQRLYKVFAIGVSVVGFSVVASLTAFWGCASSTATVLGFLIASASIGFFFMPQACLLMARQKFDLAHMGRAAGSAVYLIGAVLALGMKTGLPGVAASFFGGSVVTGWLQKRFSRGESPTLAEIGSEASARWPLVKLGFLFLVNSLGWQLIAATDSLVIGANLGNVHVARYAPTFRFVEMASYVVLVAVGNLQPVFAAATGSGDRGSIERLFVVSTRVSLMLAIPAFFLALIVGPSFICAWVGPSNYEGYAVLVPLSLFMLARAISAPCGNGLAGLGRIRLVSMLTLTEGILNLVLSVIWVDQYGLKGVAWATLIAHVMVGAWALPAAACKVTGGHIFTFIRGALLPPIVKLTPVTVSGVLMLYFFERASVGNAACLGLGLALVSLYTLWSFGLSSSQRTKVRNHLESVFQRRSSA